MRNVETGAVVPRVVENASDLLEGADSPTVVAIDIPIGLTEFSAPTRPVLTCSGWPEAHETQKRRYDRGMSRQTWAISDKIREVDCLMSSHPEAKRRFWEAHPEVSFWAWQGHGMEYSKKTAAGRKRRRQLVESHFGPAVDRVIREIRDQYLVQEVGHDDILDAFAALWTAERISRGEYGTLPENPPADARGIPMRIVY